MTKVDWSPIRLVVFDVDGTLYDQSSLRRAMAVALVRQCLGKDGLRAVHILRAYRKVREDLGDSWAKDFVVEQFRLTARQCRCEEAEVRAVVSRWIEREPLTVLPKYKAPGIDRVFKGLKQSGRCVAAWSDHPAVEKLGALGLAPDVHVWSGDNAVGRLKPHPAGLAHILKTTGITAAETLVIGDRFDRDWAAAHALGIQALIRTRRRDPRSPTFRDFRDPLFAPLLEAGHA